MYGGALQGGCTTTVAADAVLMAVVPPLLTRLPVSFVECTVAAAAAATVDDATAAAAGDADADAADAACSADKEEGRAFLFSLRLLRGAMMMLMMNLTVPNVNIRVIRWTDRMREE
jgi:hypothetical protein